MKRVLVIGSINMDLVIKTHRLPKMGETVYGNNFAVIYGGKGANQAIAAARLGCEVDMIGAVGNDEYGRMLIENLKNNNVGTDGVKIVDTNSGIAVITVYNGDNSIILDKGANAFVDIKMIDDNKELIEKSDIIVMQFEIPIEAVVYAAKLAKSLGKKVIVNPAPAAEIPEELYSCADIFIPNQYEAENILKTEIKSVGEGMKAVAKLKEKNIPNPIITMGSKGCVFIDKNDIGLKKAYKVNAADSTGAGDSFIGGICKGLSKGMPIEKCIEYATCVSAITVSRFGASASFPKASEVENFLEKQLGQ